MQLVNLLIVFVIWFPFLKAMDKLNLAKEKNRLCKNQLLSKMITISKCDIRGERLGTNRTISFSERVLVGIIRLSNTNGGCRR